MHSNLYCSTAPTEVDTQVGENTGFLRHVPYVRMYMHTKALLHSKRLNTSQLSSSITTKHVRTHTTVWRDIFSEQNFADGSKNENSRIKFHGCWLTMLNENTIMPNSQIIFSRMLARPNARSATILSREKFPLYGIHTLWNVVVLV